MLRRILFVGGFAALAIVSVGSWCSAQQAPESKTHLLTQIEAARITGGQYWGCNNTRCKEIDCTGCMSTWGTTCELRLGGECGRVELVSFFKAEQEAEGFEGSSTSGTMKCGKEVSGQPDPFFGGCSGRCANTVACGATMWTCTEARCSW